ncbi:hypothetical protein Pka01_17740 [Planotetraspora kaengkrachanensis]|uniref:Uncharacterized protein n=1 Tax=Planotetraspora kaengkrachanensis TaxID=575193 RepID=A0A8J3PQZ9_9ACTN|nr:hypothetical protein Pka01_17740 [Planotetraspora kaengkrachanensis]
MERGDHVQSSGQSLDEVGSLAALRHRRLNPSARSVSAAGRWSPVVSPPSGAVCGSQFITWRTPRGAARGRPPDLRVAAAEGPPARGGTARVTTVSGGAAPAWLPTVPRPLKGEAL